MASEIRLTMARARDIQPQEKRFYVKDAELKGLQLAVQPSGAKAWYVVKRVEGKPQRSRLGDFPAMTVDDARKLARAKIVDIGNGINPNRERRERREKERTFSDLFGLYVTAYATPRKRDWQAQEKKLKLHVPEFFRQLLLSDIDVEMIASVVARVQQKPDPASRLGGGPGAARSIRSILSKVFAVGVKHRWVQFNPVQQTEAPQTQVRERYLNADELARFKKIVDKLSRTTTRDFIWLALYTGQRRSNVASMRWDEIDLQRKLWTIPGTKFKNKRSHTVPLVPEAVEILTRRAENTHSPFVLPGPGKTGHIVEPKAAIQQIREKAGLQDFRFHDIRRTLGAWQNAGGTSLRIIQRTLGHSNIATTAKVYTPTEDEPVREAMAAAVSAMNAASHEDASKPSA